jgi:hypothetical protein
MTAVSHHALAHLLFVAAAVLDVRSRLPGPLGEALFWGLATLSCWYVGTTFGRGGGGGTGKASVSSASASASAIGTHTHATASSSSSSSIAQNKADGLQILIARWGTSRKEVDVTDKVQQMVLEQGGASLRIPRQLSFNKVFGDPLPFRRKKLRIVALINGVPYVNAIRETRNEDVVIAPPIAPPGQMPVDTDGAGVDQDSIETRSDDIQTAASIGRSALGSPRLDGGVGFDGVSLHPVMQRMTESFSKLAEALPFTQLEAEDVVEAVDRVGEMISLFGASMLPVRTSVTDNVVKIRKQLAALKKADEKADTRLAFLILADVATKHKGKKEGSVCLSALWMKRCMDFQLLFLKRLIDGVDSYAAAKEALDAKLVPWQGWLLRTTCRTGMKMVPTRAKIIAGLLKGGGGGVDPDIAEAAVMDSMRRLLAGFSVVLLEWGHFVEEHDLNFPEKA